MNGMTDIKKPEQVEYTAPDVAWEEPFEPLIHALSCGKDPDQGGGPPCFISPST